MRFQTEAAAAQADRSPPVCRKAAPRVPAAVVVAHDAVPPAADSSRRHRRPAVPLAARHPPVSDFCRVASPHAEPDSGSGVAGVAGPAAVDSGAVVSACVFQWPRRTPKGILGSTKPHTCWELTRPRRRRCSMKSKCDAVQLRWRIAGWGADGSQEGQVLRDQWNGITQYRSPANGIGSNCGVCPVISCASRTPVPVAVLSPAI